MAVTVPTGKAAFAALYEAYEQRAYNLAYRITGSEADAADATEEAFLRMMRLPQPRDGEDGLGPLLFSAIRKACHDLLAQRQPGQSSEAPPDTEQRELWDANMRLPERQREALALRELGELSYEEIAASMETSPNSVAKLISRARINLSDDLCGTALAAVAAPSPECERALPTIAAREDGQLEAGSDDGSWLDAHLARCERCSLGVEAMEEAGASYRAWAPIAALPWLFDETMAKAATLPDVEWGEEIVESRPHRPLPPSSSRQRRVTAAAGLVALLLGGALATVLVAGYPLLTRDQPVADTHPASPHSKRRQEKRRAAGATADTATAPATITASSSAPPSEFGEGTASEPPPADRQGTSGLRPQQATSTPKPTPPRNPPSPPASAPASPAQPPAEEPAPEHPSKGGGPLDGVLPDLPRP